jgi:molybdate transport system substrate-binding protein
MKLSETKEGVSNMKKNLSIALILALCVCFAAFGGGRREAPTSADSGTARPVELVVFAAASMTETLQQIAPLYKTVAPNVNLIYNFDSSGTLKTQIQQGADCDVFISAGQLQVNQLDIAASPSVNTDRLDFVLQGTRVNLLENRVTLCVPSGNPAGVLNFNDLAEKLRNANILFAMGNSDVPVGQYTQRILAYYNLDERALAAAGKITYGSNVKEITTQISEASVSCGVIYCTDAFSASLQVLDYATAEMCGQIIYPAAVLNVSKNVDEAKAFLAYLLTPPAMAVFEKVGFAAVR